MIYLHVWHEISTYHYHLQSFSDITISVVWAVNICTCSIIIILQPYITSTLEGENSAKKLQTIKFKTGPGLIDHDHEKDQCRGGVGLRRENWLGDLLIYILHTNTPIKISRPSIYGIALPVVQHQKISFRAVTNRVHNHGFQTYSHPCNDGPART